MSKERPAGSRLRSLFLTLSLIATIVMAVAFVGAVAIKIHSAWILPEARTGWNAKNVAKINKPGESFSFAVMGDNKSSNRTFNLVKHSIQGQKDLLFTIDMGDLVFDGEPVKYRLFQNQVLGMKAPFITAVGNHDIEADGMKNYETMFGPRYYSFTAGDNYFIVLDDSDCKSVDPAQMKWFEKELQKSQSYGRRFVFLHVPPFRGLRNPTMPMEEFLSDRKNADAIRHLCVQYTVNYVFGSHMHTFDYDLWPYDVHVVITGGGGAELWDVDRYRDMHHYIKVTVTPDRIDFEVIPIFSRWAKFFYMYVDEPWTYTYAYVTNNFAWLIACLGVALAGAVVLTVWLRKRLRGGREDELPDQIPGE